MLLSVLLLQIAFQQSSNANKYGWIETSASGESGSCCNHNVNQDLVINVTGIQILQARQRDNETATFEVRTQSNLTNFTFVWQLESVSNPAHPKDILPPCWINTRLQDIWQEFQSDFGSNYTTNWLDWNWKSKALWKEWFETNWSSIDSANYTVEWSSFKPPALLDWWKLLIQIFPKSGWNPDWDFSVDADWNSFNTWLNNQTFIGDLDVQSFLNFRSSWVKLQKYYRYLDLNWVDIMASYATSVLAGTEYTFTFDLDFLNYDYDANIDRTDYVDFILWKNTTAYNETEVHNNLTWLSEVQADRSSKSNKFVNEMFKNVNNTQQNLTIPTKNLKPRYTYSFVVLASYKLENGTEVTYKGRQNVTVGDVKNVTNLEDYVDIDYVVAVVPKVVPQNSSFWVFYNFTDVEFPESFGKIDSVDIEVLFGLTAPQYLTVEKEKAKKEKEVEIKKAKKEKSEKAKEEKDKKDKEEKDKKDKEEKEKKDKEEKDKKDKEEKDKKDNGKKLRILDEEVETSSTSTQDSPYFVSTKPSSLAGNASFDNPNIWFDSFVTIVVTVKFDSGQQLTGIAWGYLIGQYYNYWGFNCTQLTNTSTIQEYSYCGLINSDINWQKALLGLSSEVQVEEKESKKGNDKSHCTSDYCGSNGRCVEKGKSGKKSCVCNSGYFGEKCELDATQTQVERNRINSLKAFLLGNVATTKTEKIAKNTMISDLAKSPVTTDEQKVGIIDLVSSNIALAESSEELTPLVDGLSGLISVELTVEARDSLLDSLADSASQLFQVIGADDTAVVQTDNIAIVVSTADAGLEASVSVPAVTIDGADLPSLSIDIPAGVTGENSTGITVVITPASIYSTDNTTNTDASTGNQSEPIAPFVDIKSVTSEGNQTQIQTNDTAPVTFEIPLFDFNGNVSDLKVAYWDPITKQLSDKGVKIDSIDEVRQVAIAKTTHFTAFTVTTNEQFGSNNNTEFQEQQYFNKNLRTQSYSTIIGTFVILAILFQ